MWRITRLYLRNNKYVYSGLNTSEIELDFAKANKNSKLNLLIGQMGSGKSAILGHLQPYASFGTLDSRNSESMILPETDGLKVIEFDHDDTHYIIRHEYIWNKNTKSHNIKSYIEKNDFEMNTNGNSNSFKEIIKLEFGIEQNFLRVLRLGPNVSNVINMKSAERKSFIASLREDTELYLYLYKKLQEDFRSVNASINSISNRLIQLSSTKESEMEVELDTLQDDYKEMNLKINNLNNQIAELRGANNTLYSGNLSHLEKEYQKSQREYDKVQDMIGDIEDELKPLDSSITLESISMQIGTIQGTINSLQETNMRLQVEIDSHKNEINRLQDTILLHDNSSHLDEMRQSLKSIEAEYQKYTRNLSNFTCPYQYHFLASFIDNLSLFQSELNDVAQNEDKVLYKVMFGPPNIGTWVTDKVNMLTGRKVNLQKTVNNIHHAAEYCPPFPLFRAPFCPTKDCPYYTTHPVTTQNDLGNKKDTMAQLARIDSEVMQIDAKIAHYQEYPAIQKRVQFLMNQWKTIIPVLQKLGITSPDVTLYNVLTNDSLRRDWYHYDTLTSILEKCKMQMDYEQLTNSYLSMKNEIALLESPEYGSSKHKLETVKLELSELITKLKETSDEINKLSEDRSTLEYTYSKVQKRSEIENNLHQLQETSSSMRSKISEMENIIKSITTNTELIHQLEVEALSRNGEFKSLSIRIDKLKMILSQIAYNKSEYSHLLSDRENLKLILDAVSSKEGIPLILIKVFLDNCKETVNELISDVFDDDLEILDFDISETDFKIPYMINGQVVNDIEYASQGQQSIISIALSFALVRQSMFDYNIMLLDEIDGPLHRGDREKFITILFKQMAAIQASQVFLISHNNTFEGNPINVIMTTDEPIENSSRQEVIRLY